MQQSRQIMSGIRVLTPTFSIEVSPMLAAME